MLLTARANALALPVASGSIQLVAGSPAYWNLRSYGNGDGFPWPAVRYSPMPGLSPIDVAPMECQLGHEETPEAFIAHLVACYREARRVLHETGTLWVNIGDTYNSSASNSHSGLDGVNHNKGAPYAKTASRRPEIWRGLPVASALGIPWRLAFAMQADGWILRSAVTWKKPNPLPSSVRGWRWERHRVKVAEGGRGGNGRARMMENRTGANVGGQALATWADCPGCPKCEPHDGLVLRRGSWRPTSSYEHVFMFAKSSRYWADGEPVREAHSMKPQRRNACADAVAGIKYRSFGHVGHKGVRDNGVDGNPAGRNLRDVWKIPSEEAKATAAALLASVVPSPILDAALAWEMENEGNLADVWTIATRPNPLAHFAAYPEDLVRPIVLSSTPERCCSACGMPWSPVVEREVAPIPERHSGERQGYESVDRIKDGARRRARNGQDCVSTSAILGHRPSCACDAPHRPARVLDQFGGTGTTARVARSLGRTAITLDAELGYCVMARDRAGETCIVAREERPRTLKTITGPLFA